MASWDITEEVETIAAATGQDYNSIATEIGVRILGIDATGRAAESNGLFSGRNFNPVRYEALGRRDQAVVEAAAAKWARAMSPVRTAEPLATASQVSYIESLLARGAGDEGGYISGGPTTHDQIARLTRRQASEYIDSLTGRY